MAGIPNQSIVAKVKDTVHRQAEFNDSQVGGKVSGTDAEQAAEDFADFVPNLFQVAKAHAMKIMSRIELFQ